MAEATVSGGQTEVIICMSDRRSSSWFYPRPTGDPGRDRNARTLQFACFLWVLAVTVIAVMDALSRETREMPTLVFAVVGLLAAAVINRAGRTAWAARTAILAILLTPILMVFAARDGFRSHAMLIFPGLLLVSVMLLDRTSYAITAGAVLLAVSLLGIAERTGLTAAIPGVRSATSRASILDVDLILMVFALVGSRIARDAQRNVSDLRTIIDQSSAANLALTETAVALRQSELKYRRLHESITDGVMAVDMAGRILQTNPTFQTMLGYTGEQLCGFTYQELTPERWHAFEAKIVAEQVLARGHSEVYEKEYRRCDGTLVPVELRRYLLRDESDKPVGMWAIVRNLTEHKRDEQAISEGEQRLRVAKDAAKLGIYEYDIATGTILWDAKVRQLWGVGPDVPITIDTFFSGLHPEDRAKTRALLDRALDPAGDGEYYAEYRAISAADGNERWMAATGRVFFENGRPTHMIGTGQDISERKRAEGALRESEERFRFAQRAARIGTFDLNIETGVNMWTPELEAMYGLPPGGFARKQEAWEELIHPDDRTRVLRRVAEGYETGLPVEEEWRVVWPDGNVHWIAGRWQVFKDAAGEPFRMMGVNIDATDRKNIEEALRKSEERFRLAIKATNDAIWDIDLKTGTVTWNETYSTCYGRPPTADSWQWWIDNIHTEDRERTVGDLRTSVGSGATSWSGEYRFRRIDGEWAHIYDRAYIARDASGNAWRVIGAMQDLTERKQAETNLRESEERFRRVFEEGPLGLALVARDYRFLKVNSALCRMVGYPEEEFVQKTFADITHPEDLEADMKLAGQLFRREIPYYRLQKRYVKKNGEILWINLTASVVCDADGRPLCGLAMVEDMTEVRRTQEEALASQKLETVGTLASGIAHDFNNLLGAVEAQAELALVELDAGASCKEELEMIREVSMRGSEIVRQLMIYAGKETEAVGLINLSEIVEEMLPLLKVTLSKHAVLTADLARDLPPTRAGAAQLRQILMNLITNASDAIGDREGVIHVTTRRLRVETEPALVSQTLPERDYLTLEVSDTGCGMPSEIQGRVFDPFFTTKSAGRGLGLAVVSGIVRGLGGSIRLTSKEGKGTAVQILLTSVQPAGMGTKESPPAGDAVAGPKGAAAVLIVEDEDVLRGAVAKMLRKTGFDVVEAADGSSAIDLLRARARDIDLILLDMTIPGASSHEVVKEAAKTKPDIRVVLMSAYSQEVFAGATTAPQIRSFIRKPFQFAELVKTLQHSLAS